MGEPTARTTRTECHSCVHKRPVPGDAHISCAHPDPAMRGDPHGIRNGWFLYPLLFDPVWKARDCAHYTPAAPLVEAVDDAPPDPAAPLPSDASVADARAYVQRYGSTKDGCRCPACDRLVKVYRYPVSRSQAQFLIAMAIRSARLHAGSLTGWVDLRSVRGHFSAGMRLGGKYAKLRHWGLIEASDTERATWRLTTRAVAWMRDETRIARHVFILDNEVVGYSADAVAFSDALRTAFDLDDALRAPEGLASREERA